jgi:outer membrane protein OmpA-like peptidoglycan-associated protein
MTSHKSALLIAAAVCAGAIGVSACATEDYVNAQVAPVKTQVDALSAKVDEHAGQIQALNGAVQDANRNAQQAAARIEEHAASQTIASHLIATDDSTKFRSGSWRLSDEAKTSLAAFAQKLSTDNKDVYLAIEGHADSTGASARNPALGMRRAEAVRQYLYGQGVELHRMSVISLGEAKPTASNETAQGRSENRRVVIVTTGP